MDAACTCSDARRGLLAGAPVAGGPGCRSVARLTHVPGETGIMLPVASALLALATLTRLRTALWLNQRYRFTTWKLGQVAVVLLAVGGMLKLLAS